MKLETIETKLCCPFDHADLKLAAITKDEANHIHEGVLSCPVCQRIYPIIKGIPIMSPDEFREPSLEQPLLNYWRQQMENKDPVHFLPQPDHPKLAPGEAEC
jgi:uncharacterized protein YbaR (Trm112 family)